MPFLVVVRLKNNREYIIPLLRSRDLQKAICQYMLPPVQDYTSFLYPKKAALQSSY